MLYNTIEFAIQTKLRHKEWTMKNLKEVRFVATNYFNLQGLRMVPFSLMLVLVSLWANGVKYPVSVKNYLVLILILLACSIFFYGINRYYLRIFGQVKRTPESLRLEWLFGVVSGVLALGAFWLDVSVKLPLSLIGLVFAAGLLADYIRITWLVKGRFLLYYPIGALLMVITSILPLLGLPVWWHAVGLRSQIFGIAIMIGVISILAGIWGHIFLLRTLPSLTETK
jgi:hypothetical protein